MLEVACCWDDANETDIRLVGLLKKYHAKATFNINLGFHYRKFRRTCIWQVKDHPDFVNRWLGRDEMTEIYRGFKVASHGLFHLNYDPAHPEEFLCDQCENRKALEDLFQMEIPGMAYPCGVCDRDAARVLADAGFRYGRTTEYTGNFADNDEPLLLKTQAHFQVPDFLQRAEYAKTHGGRFYFWGHSCEMQNVDANWAQLESYLARFDADPDVRWVDVVDLLK